MEIQLRQKTQPQSAGPPFCATLYGQNREALARLFGELGVPPAERRMRVNQLWNWMYVRGVVDIGAMTTLGKDLRHALASVANLARPEIAAEQKSADGTVKWLLRFTAPLPGARPAEIEVVFIPEANRGTLCISSQVGCTLTCSFCHTGTQLLARNLTACEIVAQIMVARDRLDDWNNTGNSPIPRKITNIVLMGMGEPLYNFDAVKRAALIASDGEGISISKRRITLSTSGVVPMIARAGEEIGIMLAISLHGVDNATRDKLVPINKKYPIEMLLEACRNYPGLTNAKRITFEYVMLKGVNDSLGDAKKLVQLVRGIPAKINLIPFNPWPGSPYECSDWETIERFADVVARAGYASPVRTPRGRDIMAACGQLKSETQRLTAHARRALEAG
ncbi:MAG: 23S rRNA (adenine(2503)-C(2))-methyltransferase RlmN [Alphaproteobacteria bacterium]